MTLAVLVLMTLALGGSVGAVYLWRRRRAFPAPARLVGGGLVVEGHDTLVGTVGGLAVRVWVQPDTPRPCFAARVAVRCDLRLPSGLRFDTPELASLGIQRVNLRSGPWGYTMTCRGENLRRLQSNASLGELALTHRAPGADHSVFAVHWIHADGWIELGASQLEPEDLLPLLRDVVRLVQALTREAERPWRELAEALELPLGGVVHGRPLISGRVGQLDLLVQHTGSGLLAVLGRPLPELVLAHKDRPVSGLPPHPIQDPVIDMLLQARGAAGPLLKDAERVQLLLPALHGHPDSILDAQGLRLVAQDLDASVAEALLQAVRALRDWEPR